DIKAAVDAFDAAVPESECKPDVRQWLESSYRPDTNLADAGADALNRLLGARGEGLAIFRAHDRAAKRAAAPWLLRALDETLAYAGGPGEMEYLQDSAPLFAKLAVTPQARVPRWSGLIIEARIDRVLTKQGLTPADFDGPPGALEARFAQADLPPQLAATLAELRKDVDAQYAR